MSEDASKNTTQDQVQEPQTEEVVIETPKQETTEEATEVVKEMEKEEKAEETKEVEDEKNTASTTEFRAGDLVKVHCRIIEGDKVRTQPYEGIVIARKGKEKSKTFTVRRIGADNIGVERIFPLYSPNIEKIEVKKRGKVRRSKLYYLRNKVGRAAMKVKELGK